MTRTHAQSDNVAQAYTTLPDGTIEIGPAKIKLGKKTGPYATNKDPTVPPGSRSVNDLWQGRVFELKDPNSIGAAAHEVLAGETLLAAARANKRTPDINWNVNKVQAATWGRIRFREEKIAQEERFLKESKARQRYDADPDKWRKANPGKARPSKPKPVPSDDEIRAYAMTGLDTAVPSQTVYVSKEAITGKGLGQGSNDMAADFSDEAKREYTDAVHGAWGKRDPTIEALDLFGKRDIGTTGEWTPAGGVVEHNPGWASPVLVSDETVMKVRRTPEAERRALAVAAQVHAVTDGQLGSAVNRLFVEGEASGLRVRDMNALVVDVGGISPASQKALDAFASKHGLNQLNLGDQTALVRWGAGGPEKIDVTGLKKALRLDGLSNHPGTAVRARLESEFVPSHLVPEEGTGVATEALLKTVDESGIPGVYERLDAGRLPEVQAARRRVDKELLTDRGLPTRADTDKLRELWASKGLKGVKEHVAKFGSAGLPSVLLGGALSSLDQDNE